MWETPVLVKQNFPNDHDYTLTGLIEELALMERHLRDGSAKLCRCIPEKHLPLIAGFASEGYGFAEKPDEREFMQKLRDYSRIMKSKIEEGKLTLEESEELRAFARQMRHRIEYKRWEGVMEDNPELAQMELGVVTEINALTGDIEALEERQVDEILTILSQRHGIEKPKVRFVNHCNPLTDIYEVGLDRVEKDGEGGVKRVPVHGKDEIVLCRGGASPYAIAHEFCHIRDREKDGRTSEVSATACALREVGNGGVTTLNSISLEPRMVETLNNLRGESSHGGRMTFVSGIKQSLPILGGVIVGELVYTSNAIENAISSFTGTWTELVVGLIGVAIVGLGAWKWRGALGQVLVGFGLPLAANGLIKQFLPNGLTGLAYKPAAALAYAPGALAYAAPTGMRGGFPTLAVTKMAPRPGILAPSNLSASMSGKWSLGKG